MKQWKEELDDSWPYVTVALIMIIVALIVGG